MNARRVIVFDAFDDIRSGQIRFLEEASKLGGVTALVWSDEAAERVAGERPKFPQAERMYILSALRFVDEVVAFSGMDPNNLPAEVCSEGVLWADMERSSNGNRQAFCRERGVDYRVIPERMLAGFPDPPPSPSVPGRKKVLVTGCYDWFHSGHVRFFEEASAFGDLYVVVGHDANIRLLKGEGHPMVSEAERRYMVGAVKHVKQALISSGEGWLDADPEVRRLKPDLYVVNEDGDKGGKREYCVRMGMEYRVLKRAPARGLPDRASTNLRGF